MPVAATPDLWPDYRDFTAFERYVGCAIMLLDDRQFSRAEPMSVRLKVLPLSALLLFLTLAIANIASTVALCGAGLCPDDPKTYMLLQGG